MICVALGRCADQLQLKSSLVGCAVCNPHRSPDCPRIEYLAYLPIQQLYWLWTCTLPPEPDIPHSKSSRRDGKPQPYPFSKPLATLPLVFRGGRCHSPQGLFPAEDCIQPHPLSERGQEPGLTGARMTPTAFYTSYSLPSTGETSEFHSGIHAGSLPRGLAPFFHRTLTIFSVPYHHQPIAPKAESTKIHVHIHTKQDTTPKRMAQLAID